VIFRVLEVVEGGLALFTDNSDPCKLWLATPKVPDEDWSLPLSFGSKAPAEI